MDKDYRYACKWAAELERIQSTPEYKRNLALINSDPNAPAFKHGPIKHDASKDQAIWVVLQVIGLIAWYWLTH